MVVTTLCQLLIIVVVVFISIFISIAAGPSGETGWSRRAWPHSIAVTLDRTPRHSLSALRKIWSLFMRRSARSPITWMRTRYHRSTLNSFTPAWSKYSPTWPPFPPTQSVALRRARLLRGWVTTYSLRYRPSPQTQWWTTKVAQRRARLPLG